MKHHFSHSALAPRMLGAIVVAFVATVCACLMASSAFAQAPAANPSTPDMTTLEAGPDVSITYPVDGATYHETPLAPPVTAGTSFFLRPQCLIDGYPLGSMCAATPGWNLLGNGSHVLTMIVTDLVGNTTIKESTFTIDDQTAETISISSPTQGQVLTDSSLPFEFTAPERLGSYCRIDDRNWDPCYYSAFYQPRSLSNGPHTFTVKKIDGAGHVSTASVDFSVADFTPPEVALASPIDGSVIASREVGIHAPGMTNILDRCYIDRVPVAAGCYATGLTNGEHTAKLIRTDPAGNSTEATATFTVDWPGSGGEPRPLNLVVSTPTSGETVGSSVVINYSFDHAVVSALYGRVDYEPRRFLQASSSEWNVSGLREGAHLITLTALGVDGNSETVSVPITVRSTDSSLVKITYPRDGALIKQAPPRIRFAVGSDVDQVECRVDARDWEICNSFYSYRPVALSQGSHTVAVRVTDEDGRTTEDARTFVIDDVTPPEFEVLEPLQGTTVTAPPELKLAIGSGDGYAEITCRLNGQAIVRCGNWTLLSDLVAGSNELEVSLTDGAGNVATRTVTFNAADGNLPKVRLSLPIDGANHTDSALVAGYWMTAGDLAAVDCKFDQNDWSDCPSQSNDFAAPGLLWHWYMAIPATNGAHSIAVRARDHVGNVAEASATYTVADTDPPAVYVDSPREGEVFDSGSVPMSIDVAGNVTFSCSIDSATDFRPCNRFDAVGSWLNAPPRMDEEPLQLDGGAHTLRIKVTDPAGNQTQVTRNFAVDLGGAGVTIEGPSGFVNDPTPTFTITTDPAGLATECRIDGSAWLTVASPLTTLALNDRDHTLACRAKPLAGGASTPAGHRFVIDTVAPRLSIKRPIENAVIPGASVLVLFDAQDPNGAATTCSVNGSTPVACTPPYSVSGLRRGGNTLTVTARDKAGNARTITRGFTADLPPGADELPAPPPSTTPISPSPPAAPSPVTPRPKIIKRPKLDRRASRLAVSYRSERRCSVTVTVKIGKKKYRFTKRLASTDGSAARTRIKIPARITKLIRRAKKSHQRVRISVRVR